MALIVNALLMIALPIVIAVLVRMRTGAPWAWLGWGALAFVLSQVVHMPLLWAWQGLTRAGAMPGLGANGDAVMLGTLAAVCEEPARALTFRFALRNERGRSAALMVGAGHGGIEATIFGLLALLGAVNILAMSGMTEDQLIAVGATPEVAKTALEQVATALAMPWYEALGGAFERLFTIPLHLACSVLVMASLRRRSVWPFLLALLAHGLIDASIGLFGNAGASGGALELELAMISIPFAVGVLVWSRRAEPAQADASA